MFVNLQEFAEAIDLASQAIDLRPDNYEGYYARAKALMEVDSADDALRDAKLALDKAANASMDIQKILQRLQSDLSQRSIAKRNEGPNESAAADHITDL